MTGPQQYPDPQSGYGQGGNEGGGYQPAPSAPQFAPYQGGIDPERPASGGTAITAGVLAVLGGLFAIFSTISAFSGTSTANLPMSLQDSYGWLDPVQGVISVIELLTLLPGGVMLFMRKPIAKWLVVAGCVVHLISGVVGIIAGSALADSVTQQSQVSSSAVTGVVSVFVFISMIPAIATLVLVLVPLTGRYLAQGGRPPQQQQYQQYPPQQQF